MNNTNKNVNTADSYALNLMRNSVIVLTVFTVLRVLAYMI